MQLVDVDVSRYLYVHLLDESEDNYYLVDAEYETFATCAGKQLYGAITYQAIMRRHPPTVGIIQRSPYASSR